MAKRVCTVRSCHVLVDKGESRCPAHQRAARRQRGTTTALGLGAEHQRIREALIREAIGSRCPDCGRLMNSRADIVADHTTPRSVDPTSKADRVHCRPCSDAQGGRLAQQWHGE